MPHEDSETMMTSQLSDHTHELCAFLSQVKFEDIPVATIERTKDLVLDHVAVALLAANHPATVTIRQVILACDGGGESTIYGSQKKAGRAAAALINGAAAHGLSLDDLHSESFSHPGAVIISAALATAEALDASPRDFLTAVVVGYEAHGRAGAAANKALSRGFHPTAAAGVFGASAAVASLLKLDCAGFESAFGLALSNVSGVMQFAEDPEAAMKRLHAGWPAQNGLMAAQLAAAGVRGPHGALDGRFGFINVFAGSGDETRLTRDMGNAWEIDQICIKLYACCRFFHSSIDALQHCKDEMKFSVEDVESIGVTASSVTLDSRMQYRPKSVTAAQYSLPFAMASTLLLDPKNPDSFSEHQAARVDLIELMDKVTATVDPMLDSYLPERVPGKVRVTLKTGEFFEEFREDSMGTPGMPVDRDDITSKFRALTLGIGDADWQSSLSTEITELDKKSSLSPLTLMLREDGSNHSSNGKKFSHTPVRQRTAPA